VLTPWSPCRHSCTWMFQVSIKRWQAHRKFICLSVHQSINPSINCRTHPYLGAKSKPNDGVGSHWLKVSKPPGSIRYTIHAIHDTWHAIHTLIYTCTFSHSHIHCTIRMSLDQHYTYCKQQHLHVWLFLVTNKTSTHAHVCCVTACERLINST
jgi:hypothetical protein